MDKKIKVQIGERTVRIMPHMLNDAIKFGATQEKKVIINAPFELRRPIKEPLPQMKEVKQELKVEQLPTELRKVAVPEVPKRKAPVRSKSKK